MSYYQDFSDEDSKIIRRADKKFKDLFQLDYGFYGYLSYLYIKRYKDNSFIHFNIWLDHCDPKELQAEYLMYRLSKIGGIND